MSSGRAQFTAMAGAYTLGVFNDNFYKQAILILAVSAGKNGMQGLALSVFTFPFLVFAAPAGWVADRFSKGRVAICAKATELMAMLVGAAGICTGHWGLILLMLGIMGTQSTFFSPALNGSIPELFPEDQVTRVNGIVRMVITLAILAGIALAGLAQDRPGTGWLGIENGRLVTGAGAVLAALAGLGVSLWTVRRPAADPAAPFPWAGPLVTLRNFAAIGRDPLLACAVGCSVFIWFAGSLQILLINPLGLQQLGLSKSLTSALIVVQMMGIGLGGLGSAKLAKGVRWHRVLAPAAACMGLAMLAIAAAPALPGPVRLPGFFLLVGLVGVFGGLFLIPVESFIQVRPDPARRGAVLAAANFAVFAGILLSGPLSSLLNTIWRPTVSFAAVGAFSLVLSLVIRAVLRRFR